MHKAEKTARKTATLNKLAIIAGRFVDTKFPERPACYLIMRSPTSAVVSYEEDNGTAVVSTGNHRGRFIPVDSAGNPL